MKCVDALGDVTTYVLLSVQQPLLDMPYSVTDAVRITCLDCMAKTDVLPIRTGKGKNTDRWSHCPQCASDDISIEAK